MKTLYIRLGVAGISDFDTAPDETLVLNGLDTGVRRFEGPAAPTGGEPVPYVEYEIVDATFDADEAMQLAADAGAGRDANDACDDVWVTRAVPSTFALPDIRTARLQRDVYEAALERLSREIRRPAAGA